MLIKIAPGVLIISLIVLFILHTASRAAKKKGDFIESGLWRVVYALLIWALAYSTLHHALTGHFGKLSSISSFGIFLFTIVLLCLTFRTTNAPYVSQVKQFGRRTKFSVSEGLTAIIPGVEELEPVSIEHGDIEMGTSDAGETTVKKFVLPARDSSIAANNVAVDLNEIQNVHTPAILTEGEQKGYNNIILTCQVVYWTTNPKNFLSTENGEAGVESRMARLVSARIRHYSVQVTDDFFINNKDAIARKVQEDCSPGGAVFDQVELLGQYVGAVNIRSADFDDQSIKDAQAELKVQQAQAGAELVQVNNLATKITTMLQTVKDKDGNVVKFTPEFAADLVQAEDGNAIRIIGNAADSSAAFGVLQGQVERQQVRQANRKNRKPQ
jgi:regulator of protease activity HflC (stomatin/prohibitin superfamily)